MTATEDYILEQPEPNQSIFRFLHDLMMTFPGMTTKIRYRVPFYYRSSWICYLNPQKKGGVEVCFLRANEMSNANGLLDFKDRKQVAGVTITNLTDFPLEQFQETVQEALLLDEQVKYASKRKKKS